MNDPTFADVASKTVDHIADGVKTIAAAAQKVAPHAWEVAVKQQRVEAIGDIAFCLVVLVALVILERVVMRIVRAANRNDSELEALVGFGQIVCLVIGTIVMVPVIANYGLNSIQRLVNPEFYAAQAILEAVK